MSGINMFDQYLKEDDIFVWQISQSNTFMYCVVDYMGIGISTLHCYAYIRKIRTVDNVPFYHKEACSLTKLCENTPYVYKVIDNFTGKEIQAWN